MNPKDILQPLIVPLFTAIVGAVGIFFQNWQQSHSLRNRRKQAREEADEMIEFIQKWVQAQQLIRSAQEMEQEVKPKARARLDEIYAGLMQVSEVKSHPLDFSPLKRDLLLYAPTGFVSGVAHILFYLVALLILLMGLAFASTPVDESGIGGAIFSYLIFGLPLFGALLLVRAWALGIDTRHARVQDPSPSQTASVPSSAPVH